jgi:hypothetical protein
MTTANAGSIPGRRRLEREGSQAENEEPHPHDFDEFGLMKLNPRFISVSSQSSTMPAR